MAAVLNIITALGIDSSIWLQFAIFVVTFVLLKNLVFDAYFQAFLGRQGQTHGYQDKANELAAQTRELETHYQRKARGLAADIKAIYDEARTEATKEQERIHTAASEKAKGLLEKAREKIQEEYNKAREELIKQAPELGNSISMQLISSDKGRK